MVIQDDRVLSKAIFVITAENIENLLHGNTVCYRIRFITLAIRGGNKGLNLLLNILLLQPLNAVLIFAIK